MYDFEHMDQRLITYVNIFICANRLQAIKNPTEDEAGLLAAYDTPVDFTDRANLKNLIAYALK